MSLATFNLEHFHNLLYLLWYWYFKRLQYIWNISFNRNTLKFSLFSSSWPWFIFLHRKLLLPDIVSVSWLVPYKSVNPTWPLSMLHPQQPHGQNKGTWAVSICWTLFSSWPSKLFSQYQQDRAQTSPLWRADSSYMPGFSRSKHLHSYLPVTKFSVGNVLGLSCLSCLESKLLTEAYQYEIGHQYSRQKQQLLISRTKPYFGIDKWWNKLVHLNRNCIFLFLTFFFFSHLRVPLRKIIIPGSTIYFWARQAAYH